MLTGASRAKIIEFHGFLNREIKIPRFVLYLFEPLLFPLALFGILTKEKYDIVHVQGHLLMFFLFIPTLKLKKAICWTLHDVHLGPSRTGLLGKLEIWYIRAWVQPSLLRTYADAIIVHGSLQKDQLCSKKVNPSKVYVIPRFDYKYILQGESTTDPKCSSVLKDYILVFGHIVPFKGIEVLINAAQVVWQTSKKNVNVVIAGSGNTSHIQKILTEEDRHHIFTRNEWIPSNEIHDLFTRSKFLVLPYIDASQSGVLSLSYTFSKPVIVSRAGSLSEYVEHGKRFIFDINNTEQLANYIILSLCTEIGNRAYQKACDQMSLEFCCRIVNSIYESIEPRKH